MASLLTGSVLVQHKGTLLTTSREIPLPAIKSMTTTGEADENNEDGFVLLSLKANSTESPLKFRLECHKQPCWTDNVCSSEVVRLYHSALHNFFSLAQNGFPIQARASALKKVNDQIKSSGYVVKKIEHESEESKAQAGGCFGLFNNQKEARVNVASECMESKLEPVIELSRYTGNECDWNYSEILEQVAKPSRTKVFPENRALEVNKLYMYNVYRPESKFFDKYQQKIQSIKEDTGIAPSNFDAEMHIYALIKLPEDERIFEEAIKCLNDATQVATAHFCLLDKYDDPERKAVCLFVDGTLHSCLRIYRKNLTFRCNLEYLDLHHTDSFTSNTPVSVEVENRWVRRALKCVVFPDATVDYLVDKYSGAEYAIAGALGPITAAYVIADDRKVVKKKAVSAFKFTKSNAPAV